jgi:predicted nucleotidyltransferase
VNKALSPGAGRLFRCSLAEREAIVETLGEVLREEPEVLFVYVHGSSVKERPFRDVDVAVYLAPGTEAGWEWQIRLAEALEESISALDPGVAPPVDVRILNRAPMGFCYQVVLRGRLVFSRDDALRAEWVARVVARYLDLRPLRVGALKEAMTA